MKQKILSALSLVLLYSHAYADDDIEKRLQDAINSNDCSNCEVLKMEIITDDEKRYPLLENCDESKHRDSHKDFELCLNKACESGELPACQRVNIIEAKKGEKLREAKKASS